MLSLIDDLLDLRRVEENQAKLEIADVEVGPVLEDALDFVKPVLEQRGHSLEISTDRAVVRADPRLSSRWW